MGFFSIEAFDLTMTDYESGNPLQAYYYTVKDIVDEYGEPRPLSIGQLVMAICFQQATTLESDIVTLMNSMAVTVQEIEVLTGIQEKIINSPDENGNLRHTEINDYDISQWPNGNYSSYTKVPWGDVSTMLSNEIGLSTKDLSSEQVISALSTALDDRNTVNQTDTIHLQSLTNKRDQRFDLISNVIKSFNNVLVSVANNL